MLALGIVTLFLTAFTIIYYAYLANHSDHDVSFFLSVSMLSMLINLCTNMGGGNGLSVVYLIVAAVFLGVGFAVDLHETLAFYTSIGPWFKETFTNTKLIGWQILSMAICPAGIALYFVWYKDKPALAKVCGKCGIFGVLLLGLLLWMILGAAL